MSWRQGSLHHSCQVTGGPPQHRRERNHSWSTPLFTTSNLNPPIGLLFFFFNWNRFGDTYRSVAKIVHKNYLCRIYLFSLSCRILFIKYIYCNTVLLYFWYISSLYRQAVQIPGSGGQEVTSSEGNKGSYGSSPLVAYTSGVPLCLPSDPWKMQYLISMMTDPLILQSAPSVRTPRLPVSNYYWDPMRVRS